MPYFYNSPIANRVILTPTVENTTGTRAYFKTADNTHRISRYSLTTYEHSAINDGQEYPSFNEVHSSPISSILTSPDRKM